jgi:ATP-dependent phosphofructokinase / diphosphate-dependent phosphofructokinase
MPLLAPGTVVIGQSGGPTAVINQTLIGVAKACLMRPESFTRVLGAVHGVNGIMQGEFVDFAAEDPAMLEVIAGTPSSALKSVRRKASAEDCQRILARFRELGVRAFFYIGGNDTAETTHIIDHCPGYGSAAKFVAQAFMGDNLDNRSLAGIKVNIVMGRNAGWLTAASALARVLPDDGPHLIYCPEADFSMEAFCRDAEAVYRRLGRCVIAVSEGIHGPGGAEIISSKEVDSHGNKQLSGSGALGDFLADALKAHLAKAIPGKTHRVRADTFGYLQRCFPGVVSEADAREARLAGVAAVEAAVRGERSGSIAFRRQDDPYRIECFVTPLATVAKETKPMPRAWLNPAGNDVASDLLLPYLRPLVGELPRIGRLRALG